MLGEYELPMLERLADLAINGKDYVAIKCIQVAWAYMYGKPQDSVDSELVSTVERVNALLRTKTKTSGANAEPLS